MTTLSWREEGHFRFSITMTCFSAYVVHLLRSPLPDYSLTIILITSHEARGSTGCVILPIPHTELGFRLVDWNPNFGQSSTCRVGWPSLTRAFLMSSSLAKTRRPSQGANSPKKFSYGVTCFKVRPCWRIKSGDDGRRGRFKGLSRVTVVQDDGCRCCCSSG